TAIVLSGLVDTTPKARVYNRFGTTWSFDTELTASAVKFFDAALSADGHTAVIGGGLGAGGIAFFVRSGLGVWSQQGSSLLGTGASGNAQQGSAVAMSADGNTVVAGGPGDNSSTGAVWVFTRSGGVWSQQGSKL